MKTIYQDIKKLNFYTGKGIDYITDCPNPGDIKMLQKNLERVIKIQNNARSLK